IAACAFSAVAAAANPARETDAAHRSPRRDRGAPAAAARARSQVRAHLRRSWCTITENAMRLRQREGRYREYRSCRSAPQAASRTEDGRGLAKLGAGYRSGSIVTIGYR